MYKQKFVKVVK